ncbi:Type II secretion system protein N [compost metagenome]
MQQHATTLVGVAVILAMSISLSWQTADWLRLLRAPASASTPNADQQPSATAGQHLDQLFGSNPGNDASPPATNLQLTLLGSFVHADPKRSSAIIRREGSEAQRYAIDSEVASGVRLDAVYADRVELLRNGRRESLTFPRSQSIDVYVPETATENLDQLNQLEADNLAQLRERMEALRQQMEAAGTLPENAEPTDQPTESD